MILIQTPSLVIREVMDSDFENLHKIYTRPENMQFISSGRHDWTEEEIRKKYRENNVNYDQGFGLLVIELPFIGEVIGEAGIFNSFNDLSVLELGYILDFPWWGKGYGTEVCESLIKYCHEELHAKKVVCRMYAANTGSIKVCEKAGMKQTESGTTPEGHLFYRYEWVAINNKIAESVPV